MTEQTATAPAAKLADDVFTSAPTAPVSAEMTELAAYSTQVQGSTVAELRKLARKVGLKPAGKKAELVAALIESKGRALGLAIEPPAATPAAKAKAAPAAKGKAAPTTARKQPAVTANKCGCGCGETAPRMFRQGHDARHVSNLLKSWESGELTRAKAIAGARKFSDRLAAKVESGIALREERAAKKAAAAKAAKAEAAKK